MVRIIVVVIVGFSPNIRIQMSIIQGLIIHFEMCLSLDLTFPSLLPLLKYHFGPFTHNDEGS